MATIADYFLGKLPADGKRHTNLPQLMTFLSKRLLFKKASLSVTPYPSKNWANAITNWTAMGNDMCNDCTCAAVGHQIQVWNTLCQGNSVPLSVVKIVGIYDSLTATPNGKLSIPAVLQYWVDTGFDKDKLNYYVPIPPQNTASMQQAIYFFGSVNIGLQLPQFLLDQPIMPNMVWDVQADDGTGNANPNPNNGHAVAGTGYDDRGISIVSWGQPAFMTWDFYSRYSDEAYATLSQDWITSNGKAPNGMDFNTLYGLMKQLY